MVTTTTLEIMRRVLPVLLTSFYYFQLCNSFSGVATKASRRNLQWVAAAVNSKKVSLLPQQVLQLSSSSSDTGDGDDPQQNEIVVTQQQQPRQPDPSIMLLSAQSDTNQRLGFVGIVALLAVGTAVLVQLLGVLQHVLPEGWYEWWRDYLWAVPMGVVFTLHGVSHFTMTDSYVEIVPPPGTWGGIWNVPAPGAKALGLTYQQYHTYWSGIAEIGLGSLMVLSGVHAIPLAVEIPAGLLFLLTIAVTPTNIYMFTHNAPLKFLPPVPYPEGHIIRGALQCVILSLFWKLAFH